MFYLESRAVNMVFLVLDSQRPGLEMKGLKMTFKKVSHFQISGHIYGLTALY